MKPTTAASVPGRHHVSKHTRDAEVYADFEFPDPLIIVDSTIRKTHFTAGATTSDAGYLRIAEALVGLGVRHESVNVNWSGSTEPAPQDWNLLANLMRHDLGLDFNVYADVFLSNGRDALPVPAREALLRFSDLGVTTVAPGILEAPDSDAELRQADELAAFVDHARRLGMSVTITLAQVGLRDFDSMMRMANRAVALGAQRLDLMDSSSSMSPEAMRVFVRRVRSALTAPVPITMHMHDEFGLATAGTLAAVTAGASPDVSVNGMSYRAGFAPLEEVVMALETLYGVPTGLEVSRIAEVSRVVAEESGLAVPALKPLTGRYAFLKHMPGDVAQAITRGPDAFPPISHGLVPGVIGAHQQWVWAGLSAVGMAEAIATAEGLTLDSAEAEAVRGLLDRRVALIDGFPRWLEPEQARSELLHAVAALRAACTPADIDRMLDAAIPSAEVRDRIRRHHAGGLAGLDISAREVVRDLDDAQLREFADRFQPLGVETGRSGARGAHSAREESGIAGSGPELQAAVISLAERYRERHGVLAVVAADGKSAYQVIAELARRIDSDWAQERRALRSAIATIVGRRLERQTREFLSSQTTRQHP